MIEKIVRDHLAGYMSSVPVEVERAEKPPEEFVLIERTGGGEENHIRRATIAVQTYAKSLYRAAFLMEEAIKAMLELPRLNAVSSVKLQSYYNFTDTTAKQYRYQGVFDLVYYPETEE